MHAEDKRLETVWTAPAGHWVGDGFPVRTLFDYARHARQADPFLLLDYAGPYDFPPAERPRGVGPHPHRGFETVTLVYGGEIEHRDSAGGGGRIGPDEAQWMTAGAGLVHQEYHGREFTARGGRFECVQLWVNLPAAHKMTAPRYQTLTRADIPEQPLPGGGRLRVLAGELEGLRGPAQTFSPLQVADLRLAPGTRIELDLGEGDTLLVAALDQPLLGGPDRRRFGPAAVGVFGRGGRRLHLAAPSGGKALLLAGKPLNEPVVGMGPFVMNDEAQIRQAVADYQAGRMGRL